MNILYILGNGFDIAQGLDTRYTDFLRNFLCIAPHSENPNIKEFLQDVKEEFEKWADLEFQLGKWLDGHVEKEKAKGIFDNLVESMSEYMREQQERVTFNEKAGTKMLSNMVNVDKLLEREEDKTELRSYYSSFIKQTPHTLKVITLNYTNTFEKLVFKEGEDRELIQSDHNMRFEVKKPIHLHGTVDDGIVLGLDNENQIKDKNIIKDESVSDRFIKLQALTHVYRNNMENLANEAINNANLICIFGTAFSITDKRIWKKVMKRANEGCRVILFHYSDDNFSKIQAYMKRDKIRELNRKFVENSGTTTAQNPLSVPATIHGEYNSDIFNLGLTIKPSKMDEFDPFKFSNDMLKIAK